MSHSSDVSTIFARLLLEAVRGSRWFLSKAAFSVKLKSTAINEYSSLLQFLMTLFSVSKKANLSVPTGGA